MRAHHWRPVALPPLPPFLGALRRTLPLAIGLGRAKKQERTPHQLDDLLGDRAEDQRMPPGDSVRGDHDHVDVIALHHLHDVAHNVITDFDAGGRLHAPGRKNRMALRQMTL